MASFKDQVTITHWSCAFSAGMPLTVSQAEIIAIMYDEVVTDKYNGVDTVTICLLRY